MSRADAPARASGFTCLVVVAVVVSGFALAPVGMWGEGGESPGGSADEGPEAPQGPSPSPAPSSGADPGEPSPEDLPRPYPEPRVVEAGRAFVPGPGRCGAGLGVVPDPRRGVVHVAPQEQDHALALDPASGEVVYEHEAGVVPLAVVGNRLVAQGDGRLWVLDTEDGAAVQELEIAALPASLTDPRYRGSVVRVREGAGDGAVVVVEIERHELEVVGGEPAPTRRRYAFGLDVATGRVVARPPAEARRPLDAETPIGAQRLETTGLTTKAFGAIEGTATRPSWRHVRRQLYRRRAVAPPPPTPLPTPYPEARPTGEGRPFEPGATRRPYAAGGLADPERGVFHVMRAQEEDLVALDPATGEVVYVHAAGDEPLAVVGNRLLARSDGRLWILDTHDGAAVYELAAPELPPLLDLPGRRVARVSAAHCQGSVVAIETYLREQPAATDEVEERTAATTRYVFGLDVATGEVVAAPPRDACELMSDDLRVGSLLLTVAGGRASAGDLDGDWREKLWELPVRGLVQRLPPQVEADGVR